MMKEINSLIILFILMMLTSCKFERENNNKPDVVNFNTTELVGHWIRTNKIDEIQKKSKEILVPKFILKDNFTAEIQILDSTGNKTIFGNWKVKEEQEDGSKNFNILLDSDIVLIFDVDNNHRQMIALSVEEINNENILVSQIGEFKKE